MTANFTTNFKNNNVCEVEYNYNGNTFSEEKEMSEGDESKCLAYGYNIIGNLNEGVYQVGNSCSVAETTKAISAFKSLITPVLTTEIIIIVGVVVMRILRQLRPI